MFIVGLPEEIQIKIKDCLWGTTQNWQNKLDITHTLPTNGLFCLTDVSSYTIHNKPLETEDCLYCNKCGEKTLFFALSFSMDRCFECDAMMRTSNI